MKKLCLMLVIIIVCMLFSPIVAFAADADTGAIDNNVKLGDAFTAIVLLAILIESLAETVKAAIIPVALPKWIWFIITAILGSVLCIFFGVDVFTALGFAGERPAVVLGQIITGIAVGAGSGFVHTLLDRMTAAKNFDKMVTMIEPINNEAKTQSMTKDKYE